MGLNYARDWSQKFETNIHVEYGKQDVGNKDLIAAELMTKYNFTKSKSLILTIENTN
ncbi:MAG: hypothetical protein Fur0010_17970 [Bdellovibrio sp.]